MLASAAVSHLFTGGVDRTAILIAFCAFDEPRTHTARGILASLLRQILQLQDMLSEPMKKLYTEHATGKKPTQLSLDEICGALSSELERFQATFVILDGLDEIAHPA